MSLSLHPVCFAVAVAKMAAKRWLIGQPGLGSRVG
jgi:hypothetical protein